MRDQKQKGFTIIELVLFLAMTALFLLIALNGIRGRTANIQLTDSVRSLESAIETEISGIFSGVNALYGTPISALNSSGSKIIIGRYFETTEDSKSIKVYPIIGNRLTPKERDSAIKAGGDIKDMIYNYIEPEVVDQGVNTYELEWGLTHSFSANVAGGGILAKISGFAFMVDPFNGGLTTYQYAFKKGSTVVGPPGKSAFDNNSPTKYYPSFSTHLCLVTPENRYAEISVGSGNPQENIDTAFDQNVDERLKTLGCQ